MSIRRLPKQTRNSLTMPPITRSKTRHMRTLQPNLTPPHYQLAARSDVAHCELVSRKPYSRFHTLPTEIIDAIYDIVSGGNAERRVLSCSRPFAIHGELYDSLVAFDAYLWEIQAPCTLRSAHPRDFMRDFHRQGRWRCFDYLPVFDVIPHYTGRFVEDCTPHEMYFEDTFFEKLSRIVRLQILIPYIFNQLEHPPSLDDVAPNADIQFGCKFYEYALSCSDRYDILGTWRLALAFLPDDLDVRDHRHRQLYNIWHEFLHNNSLSSYAFAAGRRLGI